MAKSEERVPRTTMEDGKLKIAMLGSPAVGKSAILNRFVYQSFNGRYEKSMGDIFTYVTEWEGGQLELEITDVPGSDDFEDMQMKAIEENEAFILVYSTDDGLSFREVTHLREIIFDEKQAGVPMVIVENKIDLPRARWFKGAAVIPRILEAAWENPHQKISAKEGADVSDIFEELVFEAQKGLRKPSRGSRAVYAYNALQDVLFIINETNK